MTDEKVEEEVMEEEAPKPKRKRRKKKVVEELACPENCDGSCEDCDREDCDCKKESMDMVDPKEEVMAMVERQPHHMGKESVPTTARKLAGIKKEKNRLVHKYLGKTRRL